MPTQRDRPYAGANFLVDFGDGKAGAVAGGFSEVIFPVFEAVPDDERAAEKKPGADGAASAAHRLVLRRGFIGALDLYAWWHKARSGRAPKRRSLHVRLLGDDHETVVAVWRFREVRPVSLSYSPLRANEAEVVIETLELAFTRMEML